MVWGPSRRQILVLMGIVAAGTAAGVGAVGINWWDQTAETGFVHLSQEEIDFVQSFSSAAFPVTKAINFGGGDAELPAFFDQTLSNLADTDRKLVRLLLHGLDHIPLATHGTRFRKLDLDARQDLMEAWGGHDSTLMRQAVQLLLTLLGMGFLTHPKVAPFVSEWHGCGYGR